MIHPEPLRHRLHRLAPTIQHQTPQIQPARHPLIRSPKQGEHLPRKGIQLLTNRSEPTSIHTPILLETRCCTTETRRPNKVLLVSRVGSDFSVVV